MLLGIIAATALFSVWLNMSKRMKHRKGRVRKGVYMRFCIDEFLQKGIVSQPAIDLDNAFILLISY